MKKSIVFKPYDGMAAKVGDVVYSACSAEGENKAASGRVVYTNKTQFIVDWYQTDVLTRFARETAQHSLSYRVEKFLVNGFEVPCPISEVEDPSEVLYAAAPGSLNFYQPVFPSDAWRTLLIRRQLVHKTSGAAWAHAKAMLGIDPRREASLEDAENGLNDPSEE